MIALSDVSPICLAIMPYSVSSTHRIGILQRKCAGWSVVGVGNRKMGISTNLRKGVFA